MDSGRAAGAEPRRPQLKDIAALAGVSFQTVSRALTGSPKVAPGTRERIEAIARELGYRPHAAARALVTGRSSQVLVLTGSTSRFGYAQTLHGIVGAAGEAGFGVGIAVLPALDRSPGTASTDLRRSVDRAVEQDVDGVVVLAFDLAGVTALDLLPEGLPRAVAGGPPDRRFPQVRLAEGGGAARATRHLLELGHRTVHLVAPEAAHSPGGRVAAWRRTLREAGRDVPPPVVAGWSAQSAREVAGEVVAAGATAVLCANDDLALGLVRGLSDLGRSVPDDVSVVGFDDIPYAALWSPGLTTVRQDFARLGSATFEELLAALGRAPRRGSPRTLATELMVRESTSAPRRGR